MRCNMHHMHAGVSRPVSPSRSDHRQRIILPVLGGVCNEENVALGALDMTSNPYFKDHAEFQGFLLHNGMHPLPPPVCIAPIHRLFCGMCKCQTQRGLS